MTDVSNLINKKRQQIADRRAGHMNPYKIKQRQTTMRILPGWRKDGDPTFYHDFGMTWVKDFDGKVITAVCDTKLTFGNDDPVRNLAGTALANARTDAQRKHFKEMIAKPRVLINAQIVDDKDVDPNNPQIVEFSETQFETILDQIAVSGIAADFLSLEEGFDLIVGKTGTGFDTKYTFTFARKARAVNPSIMDNINDLDAFIRSKMQDNEKAANAIKALSTGGEVLQVEDRSTDYAGGQTVDGSVLPWEAPENVNQNNTLSDADIDNLFSGD